MGYPLEETPFAERVRRELMRARGEAVDLIDAREPHDPDHVVDAATPPGKLLIRKPGHPPLNSAHEAYAVILEELEEFWQEVQRKGASRSLEYMLDELVQVAAMCQRAAEDLGLIVKD